eukprot:Nitzschia sp. Nitz4//scaffold7_size249615//2602//3136//NITZ4_001132-RA/size249615-augustus-gene-0.0-mRNA-1//1//CDS//3329558307//7973//frame0
MAVILSPNTLDTVQSSKEIELQQTIPVFLKMWDGKTLCCDISPFLASSESMSVLQQQVRLHYPDEPRQRFFFETQGKIVNESSMPTMLWSNGTTIFVHYRNPGGCFFFSFLILMTIIMAILASVCTCGSSLLIVPLLLPFLFILPLFCL